MSAPPPAGSQPPTGPPPGSTGPAPGDDSGPPGSGEGRAGGRKPFLLRIPPELMDELRGWASQELRSLNAHIEYLLREALKRRKGR